MPAGQRKSTMRREIRTYIQRQIAQGVYRPGDRIVETQLAREMNVSQAPVREALLELAAMGLVEERPYSTLKTSTIPGPFWTSMRPARRPV